MHAPQLPSPQPKCEPFRPSSLRRMSSRKRWPCASISWRAPFTWMTAGMGLFRCAAGSMLHHVGVQGDLAQARDVLLHVFLESLRRHHHGGDAVLGPLLLDRRIAGNGAD